MKILAIDPGPTESAYVIWDGSHILDKGKVPSASILPLIGIHEQECKLVCEMIACYGMAVGAEVFETCVWIGRYVEKAQGQMERITRGKVKMHLCHSMKAKDANIRAAIIDRFGGKESAIGTKSRPGPLYGVSGDVWAALALAILHFDCITSQ